MNTRSRRRKRVSNAEKRARRRQMALAVARDGTSSAASRTARAFRVSIWTVRKACHEFGVTLPGNQPSERSADIVARLQDGESQSDVARAFGISRQRVHQIAERARRDGVLTSE